MLLGLLKPRPKPDLDLTQLVDALQAALKQRLKSVVVFGSYATGEFKPGHSDVNVLVVASDLAYDALEMTGRALRPWLKRGHTPPILATPDDLPGMARSFPIEFSDMMDRHKVIFGEDPLAGLAVDNRHVRAQVEHDLALARLRLRQGLAAAGHDEKRIRPVLERSSRSVTALLRAAVKLDGKAPVTEPVFQRVAELRLRRATDNIKDLAVHYLNAIETVLKHLRTSS
jgi:hypothetical protein